MQQNFEEFTEEKLQVLRNASFYGPGGPTEKELHRVEVLENHLAEYREKKARGMLERFSL